MAARRAVKSILRVTKASARPKPIDVHVGLKIRNRRKELGLSQTSLGRKVGVTFQQVQKYEKGVNRVGASRLAAIAEALEAPIGYFFPDDDDKLPKTVDVAARISADHGKGPTREHKLTSICIFPSD